jgi:disulfide bond formation protein DsbB
MLNKKINKYLIFILFFISSSLLYAFYIEHALGYKPCTLCIYERVPYIISIILIIEILLFPRYKKITLMLLSIIFIFSAILAFYHFGIEQGFFSELSFCSAENFSNTLSKEQILEKLKENNISCKNVDFRIVGLSLATINTILSLVLSVMFFKLFNIYEKDK